MLNGGNIHLDDKIEYRYITIAITPKYIWQKSLKELLCCSIGHGKEKMFMLFLQKSFCKPLKSLTHIIFIVKIVIELRYIYVKHMKTLNDTFNWNVLPKQFHTIETFWAQANAQVIIDAKNNIKLYTKDFLFCIWFKSSNRQGHGYVYYEMIKYIIYVKIIYLRLYLQF